MVLRELSEAIGPSGGEARVRDIILEAVRPYVDTCHIDALGNLIVAKGADLPGPKMMIAAHMDEIGFVITHIEKEGFLRFRAVGGIDPRILPGKAILIGEKLVPGVIGTRPIHLGGGKVLPDKDLYMDIGADDREAAAKLVSPGDYASFDTKFEIFGQDVYKGKALDDRLGCYILLQVLRSDVTFPLYGAFTVQEEIGLRGAEVAAHRIDPDVALVLEVTSCADGPDTDPHGQTTVLGQGPAISFMDASSIADKPLVQTLTQIAEKEGIPFQWKRSTFGGNDAGRIHVARGGVPTASVSLPGRYIHSPAALVSQKDAENAERLVKAFIDHLNATHEVPGRAKGGGNP